MANPRFAWGIDIGNRALKAIKLVREGDALRMEDIEVIEHDQVLSNSGDNRESLIQTALANFAQRHTTKGGVVSIGVSGQSSFARFIKLPPVEEKKIPEIVRFEAIQQIPFPLESVEWSYQLFRQPDSPDVEVGIFAMRKELVNQQIKYFTDMDMNVQAVQMNPLAVYNAMYYDNRVQDGTTMILDLGAENADLIIADGESVWLRSISIGGNNFTEALVKAFKLNFNKAEELKRNAQTSKYARQIFQAMRPIFADLVAEIQRSIGFYSSVHRDSRIKKIIALGNTFRLPTLQKYLQQNLQIEVERLDHFSAGAPDDGRLASMLNDNIASMAGAYGLALQAMGQGKIGSSLLPQEIRRAKVWEEKTKWFATAAGICLLAAGVKFGAYYWHNTRLDHNQDLARNNDAVVAKAVRFDGDWTTVETAGEPDKKRIQNVNSMKTYRDFWGDLWLDVTKSLPPENAAAPDKIKTTKRDQRKQIFIDKLESVYYPDISSVIALGDNDFKRLNTTGNNASVPIMPTAAPAFTTPTGDAGNFSRGGGRRFDDAGRSLIQEEMMGSRAPAPAPVAPTMPEGSASLDPSAAAAGKRGYLIELHCTSPYKEASTLVESVLVKDLLARVNEQAAFKDGKPYYVAKAMLIWEQQIKDNQPRKDALKALYEKKLAAAQKAQEALGAANPAFNTDAGRPAPSGYGRGSVSEEMGGRRTFSPGGAGTGGNPEDDKEAAKAYLDPVFPDESQLEDWELRVLIAVVLDPQQSTAPVDPNAAPADPAAPAAPAAPAGSEPASGAPAAPAPAGNAPAAPAPTTPTPTTPTPTTPTPAPAPGRGAPANTDPNAVPPRSAG